MPSTKREASSPPFDPDHTPPSPKKVKTGGGAGASPSKKSNPATGNRLTPKQKSRLMEMALDKFLTVADYKAMAEDTGLTVQTIKSQFAKVNWKNLRGSAIGAVGV